MKDEILANNAMETGGFYDKTVIIKHTEPWTLSSILANIKKAI